MPMFETAEREAALLDRKLAQMRQKTYIPAQLLELVGRAQALETAQRLSAGPGVLPGVELTPLDKVLEGKPLLERARFSLDVALGGSLFKELAALLQALGGPAAQGASLALAEGEAFMLQAFTAFLADDRAFFDAFAAKTPGAPRTLAFLAQASLTPQIVRQAQVLAEKLPEGKTYPFGHCPICGSLPYMSRLVTKEGVRHDECSFCRASYRVPRLQCPFCQETASDKLPFYTAEEEPGYRVDTCQTCKHYIKTTDFRDFDRPSLPPLDDLESLALDIMAVKLGFTRPTPSAWGF